MSTLAAFMAFFPRVSVIKLPALLILVLSLYFVLRFRRRRGGIKAPYPPGPKGDLLFGNIFDIPTEREWETISIWKKQYGDVVYANALGNHLVYLNSQTAAFDLLEKRSMIYSDRPDFPMAELMKLDWNFGLMHQGETWREHRKPLQQRLNPGPVSVYNSKQEKHAHRLLRGLGESPDMFYQHAQYFASSVIMDVIYGVDIAPVGDPLMRSTEEALDAMTKAARPGAFLVNVFPIMKHIPEWFPGAGFKAKGREWSKPVTEMADIPFAVTKFNIKNGKARPCFVASQLETADTIKDPARRAQLAYVTKSTSSVAYAAGYETTSSALKVFFLAMVLNPHVQEKAHAELDDVVGRLRLPDFGDRERLPYISAICKEVLRWKPVLAMGVPHRSTADNVYNGMLIPKGSIMIPNQWVMLQDEAAFGSNTDQFLPERFFQSGVRDPTVAFGFGRRACPGRYLAENSLFISISNCLHAYRLNKALDDDGHEIPVECEMAPGLITHPKPFSCSIVTRFPEAKHLVQEAISRDSNDC